MSTVIRYTLITVVIVVNTLNKLISIIVNTLGSVIIIINTLNTRYQNENALVRILTKKGPFFENALIGNHTVCILP